MGQFRDWLAFHEEQIAGTGQPPPTSSDGKPVHPTNLGQDNMKAAVRGMENPKNQQSAKEVGDATRRGALGMARDKLSKMTADIGKKNPQTSAPGLDFAIGSKIPGVGPQGVRKLRQDPLAKMSMMKKEGTFVDVPKAAFDLEKKSNTPQTVLPKKGDTISHQIGQRKRCAPVKPAKSTNVMGIKLPKTEKHVYKNPFA